MQFAKYISIINTQALFKLKSQANTLVLSYLWWVLEPLLLTSMFYLVFKYLKGNSSDSFFVFIMIGKILFLWFSKSVSAAANSIVANKGLIFQRKIPKFIFPIANIQEACFKQFFVFIVMFIMLGLNGYSLYIDWLPFFVLCFFLYILICAAGIWFSILVTYFPDFNLIVQMLMMGLMFSSGIFFDINEIPSPEIREALLVYNPLALIIQGFRDILIYNKSVDLVDFSSPFLMCVLALTGGLLALKYLSNAMTRRLLL